MSEYTHGPYTSATARMPDVYEEHYGQLVGGTIVAISKANDGGEYSIGDEYALVVKVPAKGREKRRLFTAWIQSDEEGNGTGFLALDDITEEWDREQAKKIDQRRKRAKKIRAHNKKIRAHNAELERVGADLRLEEVKAP